MASLSKRHVYLADKLSLFMLSFFKFKLVLHICEVFLKRLLLVLDSGFGDEAGPGSLAHVSQWS